MLKSGTQRILENWHFFMDGVITLDDMKRLNQEIMEESKPFQYE